jgi:hypothetical protein
MMNLQDAFVNCEGCVKLTHRGRMCQRCVDPTSEIVFNHMISELTPDVQIHETKQNSTCKIPRAVV